MKNVLLLILLSTLIFATGCETFRGFGKDVQTAGDWIEDTASK